MTNDPVVNWKISVSDLQLVNEALIQLRAQYLKITYPNAGESGDPKLNLDLVDENPRIAIVRVGYLIEKIGMK